jgi:hypothetical protein
MVMFMPYNFVKSVHAMDPFYCASAEFLLYAGKEWNGAAQRLVAPCVASALSLVGSSYHALATTGKTCALIVRRENISQLPQHLGRAIGNILIVPILHLTVLFNGIKPALNLLEKTWLAPHCSSRYRPLSLTKRLSQIDGLGNKARYLWGHKQDVLVATCDTAQSVFLRGKKTDLAFLTTCVSLAALGYYLYSHTSAPTSPPPPLPKPAGVWPTANPLFMQLFQQRCLPIEKPIIEVITKQVDLPPPIDLPTPLPVEPQINFTNASSTPRYEDIIQDGAISPPPAAERIEQAAANLTQLHHMEQRTLELSHWIGDWWNGLNSDQQLDWSVNVIGGSAATVSALAGRWKLAGTIGAVILCQKIDWSNLFSQAQR